MKEYNEDFLLMLQYVYARKSDTLLKNAVNDKDSMNLSVIIEAFKWNINSIAYEPDTSKRLKMLGEFNSTIDKILSELRPIEEELNKRKDND